MKNIRIALRAFQAIVRVCIAGAVLGLPLAPAAWAQPAGAAPGATPASRNVYSAGGQVRPAAAVEGDFIAAGGRVIVDQPVKGDATLVGGSVDLRAAVGDDVRATGGDVSIESSIGGELHAAGGNVTLTRTARVAQAAQVYGGNVTIEGQVDGALAVTAQKIYVNGVIGGAARLTGEEIELGPQARIAGALSYVSGSDLKRAEGATVAGTITREEASGRGGRDRANRGWQARGPSWAGAVFTFFALLACAAVFLLVFPMFATRASDIVKSSPWLALAAGFGALVAVPVLAVLLFITLLGIPLGIVVMALYPVLLLAGYVVGVLFIARLAQAALRRDRPASFAVGMGFFALALLAVMLLGRLPFVGGVVMGVITVLGIGACVVEVYRRRRSDPGARADFTTSGPALSGGTGGR